jgi:hypothetical protein
MSFFRKNVEAMTPYVPGEQPAPGSRVIKLNTNENPYPPSPKVAEAILAELSAEGLRLRLYSDPVALEFRKAASEATGFPIERILAGNGSDELLALIVRAIVDPGDVIAYPYPTYVLYETLAEAQGARRRVVEFPRDFSRPGALRGRRFPSSLQARILIGTTLPCQIAASPAAPDAWSSWTACADSRTKTRSISRASCRDGRAQVVREHSLPGMRLPLAVPALRTSSPASAR